MQNLDAHSELMFYLHVNSQFHRLVRELLTPTFVLLCPNENLVLLLNDNFGNDTTPGY
jgi:hypothetical protein